MNFADNTYPLPGWLLRVAEISNGYFAISLTDNNKRQAALTCTDTELPMKIQECIDWAKKNEANCPVRNDNAADE